LEKVLKTTAGKYCVGDEITAADLLVGPQCYNALRWGVDMSKFPIISEVQKNMSETEGFKKSHPSQQPDFDANAK
jgi:maleylacetoacetate isomerase